MKKIFKFCDIFLHFYFSIPFLKFTFRSHYWSTKFHYLFSNFNDEPELPNRYFTRLKDLFALFISLNRSNTKCF